MVMLTGGAGVDTGEDAARAQVPVLLAGLRSGHGPSGQQASRSALSAVNAAHRCQLLALVGSGARALAAGAG